MIDDEMIFQFSKKPAEELQPAVYYLISSRWS